MSSLRSSRACAPWGRDVIVIWGTRNAGKVDQRDGQYALTRFAHVYGLPLVPVSSIWVTGDGVGHAMKLSAKSVFAGYARTWGLIAGALGVIGLVPMWAALGAVVAAAGTVSWRDARGARAVRSDLNAAAYGTRCEPELLPGELADALRDEVGQRWAAVSDGQTPADVARFGTDDPRRAAAAYGVLRLTALTLAAPQAAEAERDASRIASGTRERPALGEGGPYRSTALGDQLIAEQPAKRGSRAPTA
jgi:hypothetical protein